ncbi:MAG: pyruvate kinase, partial [Pseudopedobacter saltans]
MSSNDQPNMKMKESEWPINTMFHRTKIVATVGPASSSYETLYALAEAGVNVFRLNFSHGSPDGKLDVIHKIRKINSDNNFNIAILGDLQGPKLRVGDLEGGQLTLNRGDILTFTSTQKVVGTKDKIYISYPNLHDDVKVGEKILIDDGKLEVVVKDIDKSTGDIKVEVTYGGILLPKKGVNLPDTAISLPAITEKDIEDLEFILEQELDWVALS